jgi:hypothetical protein
MIEPALTYLHVFTYSARRALGRTSTMPVATAGTQPVLQKSPTPKLRSCRRKVGKVVGAITLQSGDDESTSATDNYLKMRIPDD